MLIVGPDKMLVLVLIPLCFSLFVFALLLSLFYVNNVKQTFKSKQIFGKTWTKCLVNTLSVCLNDKTKKGFFFLPYIIS